MKRIHLLLLSILSGLLFSLAWPERGFSPLIFFAFVPLFFIQQQLGDSKKKGMFWYAWLAFFIWNALTTWWIWNSTGVGAILAILLNSLFVAVIFWLFHISKKKLYENKRGFFILIFYWISWEYFHMNWDLSWSWLNLGNVFTSAYKWIQWYEYTGILGGTVWVIAGNIVAFQFINYLFIRKEKRPAILYGIIFLILIIVPVSISYRMYNHYEEKGKSVEVVVVQPNSDPYNEQYDLDPDTLLDRNLKLAEKGITDSTRFLVFPESTLYDGRYGIWEEALTRSPLLNKVRAFVVKYPQLNIVIGASTYRMVGGNEKIDHAARKFSNSDRYYYAYNTAFMINRSGITGIHHKSKLTPGVEIMPSWGILKPLEKLALNLGGTIGTLKKDDSTVVFFDKEGIGVAPVICYESVYGEFVAKMIRKGAGLIFVITNDGWWGDTPGYRQHFLFSVLRAVETRRCVARSANTGISAFINQRGDVSQKTKYWVPAVIRQNLQVNTEETWYVKHGDYIADISIFISIFIFLIALVRGYLRKKKSLF